MGCAATIYNRIQDVPPADWRLLCDDPADLSMDPRLLAAFEATMRHECTCWYAIVHDATHHPAAAACLCLFQVDALETTAPISQTIARTIRRVIPVQMRFGVLFCGLPVPSGASHVRFAAGANRAQVIDALDALLRKLATENGARLIVFKELNDHECDGLSCAFAQNRYARGGIPLAYLMSRTFSGFDEYCAALRSGYRRQVAQSRAKFRDVGATVEVVTGDAIGDVFDDDVHALYLAVRDRAQYRMETLPAAFFREAGRRFGADASLTIVRVQKQIAGFTFGITAGGEYHNLSVGVDYALNEQADVYFNLYYHDLDRAFRAGCVRIHLGQTSDEFKARLGCIPRQLSFYVRAVNPLIHFGLRRAARWVFPPVVHPSPREVFKLPAGTLQPPRDSPAKRASAVSGK